MDPCGIKLTASLLSGSSLCHTRLVRSLGNLHVVAGDRDPMCWEPCGSLRDTASAPANTCTLINLNMAQASSLRPTLSQIEALDTFAHKLWFILFMKTSPLYPPIGGSHIWNGFFWNLAAVGWFDLCNKVKDQVVSACESSQNPESQYSLPLSPLCSWQCS